MDAILHVIGICGDTHSHFDLIDLLFFGGGSVPVFVYLKYKIKSIVNKKQIK